MNPNHGNEAAGMGYYYNIAAMEYGDQSGTVSSKRNRSTARGLPIMVPKGATTVNLFGNEQRVEDLLTTKFSFYEKDVYHIQRTAIDRRHVWRHHTGSRLHRTLQCHYQCGRWRHY